MDGEGWARRCGGSTAGAIVRRAHQFRTRTRSLKPSGEAERTTASYLDPHSGDGWFVLHGVALPGGAASIDHLVVTPAGVFVVESLEWSGPTSQAGARRIDRHLQRRDLDALLAAVRAVGEILMSVCPDMAVVPKGVISLAGCPSADESWRAAGVTVVPASRLVRHLTTGPHPYDAERVERLAVALDEGLASGTGHSSSLVRPVPLSGSDPPGSTIADTVSTSSGPDGPGIAAGRPSVGPGREGWPTGGRTLQNVMRPLVAVLGVVLFFYLFAIWGRALPRVSTGIPGTSPAWVATTAVSASLRWEWSCPAGGKGWTANLAWPAGVPAGARMAEVSSSPYGPWTIKEPARASRQLTLTGLAPGSYQWVRVGTSYQLLISDPIMAAQLVVPEGC